MYTIKIYLFSGQSYCGKRRWFAADAVANASGLGFNGYDELGKPRWDLVSNVDIIELEVCYA